MQQPKTSSETKHELLSRLQQKIQDKYKDIQEKYNLSGSQDFLLISNNDTLTTVGHKEKDYDDNKNGIEKNILVSNLVVEPVKKSDAFFKDVEDYFKDDVFCETNRTKAELGFVEDELYDAVHKHDMAQKVTEIGEERSLSSTTDDKYIDDFEDISIDGSADLSPNFKAARSSGLAKLSLRDRFRLRLSSTRQKRKSKKEKKISQDSVDNLLLTNSTKQDIISGNSKKNRTAMLTIALIEAKGSAFDKCEDKNRMLQCRFRVGTDKCKSKPVKGKRGKFVWSQLFNLNLYLENILEVVLMDRDTVLGSTYIDISEIEKEVTLEKFIEIIPNLQLTLLLTVTASSQENLVLDAQEYTERKQRFNEIKSEYAWYNFFSKNVGQLSMIVYGAKGLNGNDCYCVVELDNSRVQTHTDHKTCDPHWMKIFHFVLTDITSLLEITVYDEKKSEVVGKISMLLLNVNNGVSTWYALKDSTLKERAKGNSPRILIEADLTWNIVRSSLCLITPKTAKHLKKIEKLDRHLFARNLARIRISLNWIKFAVHISKTCFEWESKTTNVIAIVMWQMFCWYFHAAMLPLLLLIPFLWFYPVPVNESMVKRKSSGRDVANAKSSASIRALSFRSSIGIEDDANDDRTFIEKIQSLQSMVLYVQNLSGQVASFGESVKNLFNFTVPFISYVTIFLIIMISLIMQALGCKYIFMAWGLHKFTRKLWNPNRIPNNEILDLLSRVPDDEILLNCAEVPLEAHEAVESDPVAQN